MTDAPTLGELVRRLADITTQLTDITIQLRNDFVRKETYDAHREVTRVELDEIKGDIVDLKRKNETDQSWRRSTSVAVAIAVIGWVLTIALAIAALVWK
ncbi:hypothetical protein ACFVJS_03760 [Nocardioides sp. NPDC057772]|uniref:hypothetical protein n=1 Tax=Nocardioides sp. NPDC057772 TaxID=3346245 RepID=UPI00366CB39A